ncbi:MAG: heterodisulfide reductase-related iron-sulfur binding cluster [Promethearchaeota archaeon]
MEYITCLECGFKCERICPVSRATGKFLLSEFLEKYLKDKEFPSWPCTGCHSCDNVCPAEFSPRELIQASRREYLKTGENMLTDYHEEFLEHGRISYSSVNMDDLVLDGMEDHDGIDPLEGFDRVILFPGCVLSSRFPEKVLGLFKLLVHTGVRPEKIVVDDHVCCGSFLQDVDDSLFKKNGMQIFDKYLRGDDRTIVITGCGSCTASLRKTRERLKEDENFKKHLQIRDNIEIMHYFELLSNDGVLDSLLKRVHELESQSTVYLQYPCQATPNLQKRKKNAKQLSKIIEKMGFSPEIPKNDLSCCGSYLLDTHPDFAIEFGINRHENLCSISNNKKYDIIIGCGNCQRLYSDFKPSILIEDDDLEQCESNVEFLLDLILKAIE